MNASTFFNRSTAPQSSSSSSSASSSTNRTTNPRANSTGGIFGGGNNSSTRTTSPPTADSSSTTTNNTNGFNFSFEFPSINLSNLTDTFSAARFSSPNLSTLIPKQRSSSTTPTSRNESSSSSSSPGPTNSSGSRVIMVCENCGIKFHFLKRKKTCSDCSMDYCVNCFPKDTNHDFFASLRRTRCRRCRIFNMQPLERHSLLELRIKDLKWYMDKKRIPHRFCKEKSELVDLILRTGEHARRLYSPPNSYPTSPLNSRTTSSNTTSSNDTPNRVHRQGTDDSWVFVDPDDSGYRSSFDVNSASQENASGANTNNTNNTNTNTNTNNTPLITSSNTTSATGNNNNINDTNSSTNTTTSATTSRSTDHQNEETTSKENISYESNSTSNLNDFKPFNIDDLNSEDQIRDLSIRQIKLLLTRNFVDFKGCCEKEELLEKAIRLWRDVNKAKERGSEDLDDDSACKICMEKLIDCVLLECGHVVTCIDCGKRMNECPICRQYVVRAVRIFKS
ncbi:E3 ubiquitin-protein ligase rififylin-like [Panonychus citri]|uniref:E3 ubiquitin-protein ligase rififylin-like n=1 Tax=Panonychus citri TaxID=50023 RepID=UPI0023078A0F|nr:E3 ubiquitin-protein ligase rififylin-like [Panonychus citri]XP_053214296.1 E3 ubiquitin-protein ligase rififylin-like [Panonychus citri]